MAEVSRSADHHEEPASVLFLSTFPRYESIGQARGYTSNLANAIQPLFEVAGHPIISHCFAAITKLPGIREVFMVGYYDEAVFRDFI